MDSFHHKQHTASILSYDGTYESNMKSKMNVRLAACEPCRRSKLACGHERPACTRCTGRGQRSHCVYRSRPFRRRVTRTQVQETESLMSVGPTETIATVTSSTPQSPADAPSPSTGTPTASTQPYRYPNPGFLGVSSHSTIFNHVFSGDGFRPPSDADLTPQPSLASPIDLVGNQVVMDKAMHALSRLEKMDISKVTPLVRSWLERGVNLPLAGPIVIECLWSLEHWREVLTPTTDISGESGGSSSGITSAGYVATLLTNTLRPFALSSHSTRQDFLAQMVGSSLRWETLGIFFRRRLMQALTYIGDYCLETSLSLDCLNDLQLILQYENFIVHSHLDGDQSYHSWRRIGDLASSLFALGYHEKIERCNPNLPSFIIELRKACFCRIYTADKGLAVFLGRPPRIVKDYCQFQIPKVHNGWIEDEVDVRVAHLEPINYNADTRCVARFALLKEEVLQLLRRKNMTDVTKNIREFREKVEALWQNLPGHFRLGSSLRECQQSPFGRDFLAHIRLDYLHNLFLLGLVSQQPISEPNDELLKVAIEMLSIVVEVILLRDQLVNSGTCLIWKVAQYGLPAAGVISLALLKENAASDVFLHSRSKMIQDLSVLVAETRTGAWIQAGEPNFALFTRATGTIQTMLDSLLATRPSAEQVQTTNVTTLEVWEPYSNHQLWDFEMEFWSNLAEHPTLLA
ncbi:uncharacterized protein BDZ83DRAFT_637911 [Colletotrichum acutatum]|uniref:Zn(2)-C6 fungal-type domain-containing protein n=1 Tax=Glomerella acutata TaxID=27357 RepID=A0AAD8UDL5_GLOAC|nr:uncharacterized protein BDZ83DRAFT_637911 [Colletotrichum acutatum]KAK1713012.1 hypothetical protein BDZ83DRAFT_637911 [Colletotrichum acutatum]